MPSIQKILEESWFFFRNYFSSIIVLCLPLVLLEAALINLLPTPFEELRLFINAISNQSIDTINPQIEDSIRSWNVRISVTHLIISSYYFSVLILFLQRVSNGQAVESVGTHYMEAARLWPMVFVVSFIVNLAVSFGLVVLIIPGIWLLIRLSFAQFIVVVEQTSPIQAIFDSFKRSKRATMLIFFVYLAVYFTLFIISIYLFQLAALNGYNFLLSTIVLTFILFSMLFGIIALYRIYMLMKTIAD